MNRVRLIGLGLGILLILAAFGIVLWQGMNMPLTNVAFAQGGTTTTPTPSGTPPQTPPAQSQQQQIGDTFWGILAGSLGVNPDDLKSKAVAARQQMLDQAVKDGRITQAQADAIKQRITSNNIIAPIPLPFGQGNGQGTFPFRGGPGPAIRPGFNGFGGGFGFGGGDRLAELTAVAKALNLDAKTLVQDLSQGKTLADVAQAQNVDQATVKQAIIDTRTSQIDQLLSLGLISQAQADSEKAQLTPDKIDLTRPLLFGFGGGFRGPGRGRGFGFGFGRGNGGQPPQNGQSQPTPAPTQTQ